MLKVLIGTRNKGKIKEIKKFLSDLQVNLVTLDEEGIDKDIEETGKTYKENSRQKALFYSHKSGLPAIADDGGLEIAALGGAPGVYSRRWLGYEASDMELINYLKKIAQELPDTKREARFKTVISFAMPSGEVWSAQGEVKGIIAKKPLLKIIKGYPYRSFFFIPQLNKYYHEDQLSEEEEKIYNHRYKAVTKLKSIIINKLHLTASLNA